MYSDNFVDGFFCALVIAIISFMFTPIFDGVNAKDYEQGKTFCASTGSTVKKVYRSNYYNTTYKTLCENGAVVSLQQVEE